MVRARPARGDPPRHTARGLRRFGIEAARDAPRGRTRASRATPPASTRRRASSSPPGDACRGRCSRSSRSPRSPPRWRIVLAWRRRPDLRPWLVPLALFAFGLVICVDIHWQRLQRGAGLRLAARLGAGDAALPRTRPRHLAPPRLVRSASSLSLVFVALTVVAVALPGPATRAGGAGSASSPRRSGRSGRCSSG